MFINEGGGATGGTSVKSTSSGTTTVTSYSSTTTQTADISQEGSGTTQIFTSGAIGSIVQRAGTLSVDKQTAPLSVIGGLSFLGVTDIEFSDGFADNSIYNAWVQTPANGVISESADQIILDVADSAAYRFTTATNDAVMARVPIEKFNFSLMAHVSAISLQTPSAANNTVNAGWSLGEESPLPTATNAVHEWIGRRRTNGGVDTLEALTINVGSGVITNRGTLSTSQNTNWWFFLRRNGAQISAYYRTSEPTPTDDAFTLLGSWAAVSLGETEPSYGIGVIWENPGSDGASLMITERVVMSTDRGPS